MGGPRRADGRRDGRPQPGPGTIGLCRLRCRRAARAPGFALDLTCAAAGTFLAPAGGHQSARRGVKNRGAGGRSVVAGAEGAPTATATARAATDHRGPRAAPGAAVRSRPARRHRSRPRPVPETRRDYPHLRLSRLGGDVQARGRRALRRRQPARRPPRAALPPAGRRRRRPGRRRHGVAGRLGGGRRPRRRSRGHLRHRSRPGGQRRGGRSAADHRTPPGPAAGGRVGPAPRRPGSSLRPAGWRSYATRADSRSPSSPACSAYPRRRCTAGKRPAGRSPSEPVRRTPCRCCTGQSRNARLE